MVTIEGRQTKLLKQQTFTLQIKIASIKDLIKGCLTKEPIQVSKNSKDSHMNTIGTEYLLLSSNKNAVVVSINTHQVVAELNLKKREMSCSLFFGGTVVLIGTYVDTLFVFSYPDFKHLFSMQSHESILSMCVVSPEHQFIALG